MGSQGRKGDARKHCIPGWLCRVDGLEMAGASLAELVIKLSSASAEVETHILGKSKLTNFAHALCVNSAHKSHPWQASAEIQASLLAHCPSTTFNF